MIKRRVNRTREKKRPKQPKDLNFVLDLYHIPEDFLKKDIKTNNSQRHIILATDGQLELLTKAEVLYFDATFKCTKHPFMQLASLHSFIRSGSSIKQVPLAFILMSRRRKSDYKIVLETLFNMLPDKPIVKEVVLDFERAMWGAFRIVLRKFNCQQARLHGCQFHWAQAVFRRVKNEGLQIQYSNNFNVRNYLRQLMALPHLPAAHIPEAFRKLKSRSTSDPRLKKVLNYLEKKWVNSKSNPPASWSGFGRAIRTNNDVEGWHLRLKKILRVDHPNLYVLIDVLHNEASQLKYQISLVTQGKLYRRRRKDTKKQKQRLRIFGKSTAMMDELSKLQSS